MKTLYLIGGTMGVGKTTVCQILKRRLPDAVFLDGLRERPHPAHLTMRQAADALVASACARPYLIHIGHDIPHAELLARFPAPVEPAYDGLVVPL